MTKATFTPGPWIVGDGEDVWDTLPNGEPGIPMFRADVGSSRSWGRKITRTELLANARLIAVAPKLYAQVELFARVIEYNIRVAMRKGDDEGARLQSFTLAMTRAILAEARGEQPASVDTRPQDGDVLAAPLASGAVPKGDAQ